MDEFGVEDKAFGHKSQLEEPGGGSGVKHSLYSFDTSQSTVGNHW